MTIPFYAYVLILAALLFLPTRKIIWVLSCRRLERKLARDLESREIAGQKQRAGFIAFFVVLVFSFLFNASTVGVPHGG
ncbi:hypothetical protein J2T57_001898 [Natronocella acetinitrilica]|uniref:Uncharacterized protein n=1 Tax=Natronocella acetinitrilica TaxID=414046 RepID=A0AAE3G2U2_9GAMM|nr:hypothetical protein [Natronocella acetinitrilica]MCP1674760.1 hypothetical protein [Natronocella acetinitrilica]